MIVRKGDVGDEMYVIVEGCVDVQVSLNKPPVATLPAGSAFGEPALFDNLPRNAFVIAASDPAPKEMQPDVDRQPQEQLGAEGNSVHLLVLNKRGLARAMSRFPSVEANMEDGSWLWKLRQQHELHMQMNAQD